MLKYSNTDPDLLLNSVGECEFAQRMRRCKATIVILLIANFVMWISGILILAINVR